MKEIVFITDKVYPYFVGGQEKRIDTYARILVEDRNTKVSIISMKWWVGEDIIKKENIKYVAICKKYNLYKKNGKRKIFPCVIFGFKVFIFLLKSRGIKILDIEVFPYFPLIFSRLALFFKKNKPKIVGHWCECQGKLGWKKYSKNFWSFGLCLEKLAKFSCDYFITISEFTKKRMVTLLKINERNIKVIHPCFINFEKIDNIEEPFQKVYDFIYFGRLIWHKHVEDLINVSYQLKKIGIKTRTLIIGDGPERNKLIEMVKEKCLFKEVDFLDFLDDYDELIKKIKLAKLMIFPSEREGFGIAPIEANACGLPVMVVDYPENATTKIICNGGNGFVCKNFNELFKKTKRLITNEELLESMKKKCVSEAKKYSKEKMKDRILFYIE